MNNKNSNLSKQKRLAEKQRLEKKKLLRQLDSEIKSLEKEIKNSNISNAKIKALRVLKISLRAGQLVAPFAIAAGVTVGGFSLFGAIPFYRDNNKQYLEMIKEFDSNGNIRYEQQYEDFEEAKSTISYYGKWESSEEGFYSRNVEIYSIEKIDEEIIMKLVNQNNIDSLQEILGEPILKKIETKNNLTEEELVNDSYIQAILYSEIKDDYIVVKESFNDNFLGTLLWVVSLIVAEFLAISWRDELSSFDFGDCVREIKRKHPYVDIDLLSRKLEIKKDNYNKLTR